MAANLGVVVSQILDQKEAPAGIFIDGDLALKDGQEVVGARTRVRVTKNKVAPPFREAEFDIMYNEGISKMGDIVDLATQFDVIVKRGAFFSFGDTRLGQGRENAKNFLKQHPDIAGEIEAAVRDHVRDNVADLGGKPVSDDTDD